MVSTELRAELGQIVVCQRGGQSGPTASTYVLRLSTVEVRISGAEADKGGVGRVSTEAKLIIRLRNRIQRVATLIYGQSKRVVRNTGTEVWGGIQRRY